METRPTSATPAVFWLYLCAVHLLYVGLTTLGAGELHPSGWLYELSVWEFVGLIDVVAAPALIYGWLCRSNPLKALLGSFCIAIAGLLTAGAWLGEADLPAQLVLIPPTRSVLIFGVCALIVAYESRVLFEVARLWQQPNFDVEISRRTMVGHGDSRARRMLKRFAAIELRFWAYGLIRRPPFVDEFAGQQHFAYASQSGNASTWIAWAFINAMPAPIVHPLMHQTNPAAAWMITLATLLSSLWCIAEARAARFRPVSLDGQVLYLRYGLLTDRTIPLSVIGEARTTSWKDLDVRGISRYAGCGGANVQMILDSGEIIQIGLDDPSGFVAAVSK